MPLETHDRQIKMRSHHAQIGPNRQESGLFKEIHRDFVVEFDFCRVNPKQGLLFQLLTSGQISL
ncbi:MAG TPA: hypothetical protein VIF12_02795, partial [Micavibrio sp.]